MSRWWSEAVVKRLISSWMLHPWRQPAWVCLTPVEGAANAAVGVPIHDEALLQWRRWCEVHEGQKVKLGLSARWLFSTVLPLADGRGHAAQQQAQTEAVSRWAHLLGLDDAAWQGRWVTRTVALPQGMLVCAIPRALVDDVLAVARHHHVALQWIGPWWAHGLQQWLSLASGASPDAGCRTQVMHEPGWAVHAQADGPRLMSLWAEPAAGEETQAGKGRAPLAGTSVSHVCLQADRSGPGAVWQAPAVARILAGDPAVWGAAS